MKVELSEMTHPYCERIVKNELRSLDIMRWLAENPDCHPDVRKQQNELIDALDAQNAELGRMWDQVRDQWIASKTTRS